MRVKQAAGKRKKGCTALLVADAQPLVGEAIAGVLAANPNHSVMDLRPKTGLDAVEAIVSLKPEIAVVDYWMPEMEGPAITRLVRARDPERKVLLMAWFDGPHEVEASKRAGAAGFISKSAGVNEFLRAVEAARAAPPPSTSGGKGAQDNIAELWQRLEFLSRRQIEIIGLASMDLSASTIAQNLRISPATVKVHLRNILGKTGARSKKEVVALARSVGLIRN